jgi:hypothetical protein
MQLRVDNLAPLHRKLGPHGSSDKHVEVVSSLINITIYSITLSCRTHYPTAFLNQCVHCVTIPTSSLSHPPERTAASLTFFAISLPLLCPVIGFVIPLPHLTTASQDYFLTASCSTASLFHWYTTHCPASLAHYSAASLPSHYATAYCPHWSQCYTALLPSPTHVLTVLLPHSLIDPPTRFPLVHYTASLPHFFIAQLPRRPMLTSGTPFSMHHPDVSLPLGSASNCLAPLPDSSPCLTALLPHSSPASLIHCLTAPLPHSSPLSLLPCLTPVFRSCPILSLISSAHCLSAPLHR